MFCALCRGTRDTYLKIPIYYLLKKMMCSQVNEIFLVSGVRRIYGTRHTTHFIRVATTEDEARQQNLFMKRWHQRIFMYKELTAAPFVVTTSVFCCRKPEAVRKTTPEPLLAEW